MNRRTKTGFTTQTTQTQRLALQSVSSIDVNKVECGNKTKNKGGPGNHVPIFYNKKPLSFQAKGLFVSFAGSSKKQQAEHKDPVQRAYSLLINGEHEECEYLPNKKGEGPAFLQFNKDLCEKIETIVEENSEKWGIEVKRKDKATGKMTSFPAEFKPSFSEGTRKKDKETGEETDEFHPDSVILPLRTVKENNVPVDKFTTKFINAKTGKEMNITPTNINESIPYGTFAILSLNYGRLWLGSGETKITIYCNEAKLLLPNKNTFSTDDFIGVDDDDEENSENDGSENDDGENDDGDEEFENNNDDELDENLDNDLSAALNENNGDDDDEEIDIEVNEEKPKTRRRKKSTK